MRCSSCGRKSDEPVRYCRSCGAALDEDTLAGLPAEQEASPAWARPSRPSPSADPDELVGAGIGKVITGDGLLMVALALSVTHTSVSSLLWLLLLIPTFY